MTEPTTITIAVNATMKPVSTAPLTTNENLIKSSASTATATTITTRSATTMQMSSESIFTKKEFSSTHEVSDHGNFSDMTTRSTMMQTPELSTMMQTIPDLSSMMMNTQDLSTMNAALSTTEASFGHATSMTITKMRTAETSSYTSATMPTSNGTSLLASKNQLGSM
ncbi:unnamed protein product [Rotaria socialis]|uniref:Uncharacterized protein n=1 Tax=Rotaria socialis TaxID=392032 RepID=A0A818Z3I2_9BILA|nr:unnamed protein product [Rotaria socialis]CAF3427576.1 unnamed protein product [Rotaria socialis]CAF3765189.1 unnamed protein product [Rotaria socialis]